MLPPSAVVAEVVIALFWMRRLLPMTTAIFPAFASGVPVLVAEIVACSVNAISGVLIVTLPPSPLAVAFEDTAAPAILTGPAAVDRKSTRLNSSHTVISYAVFCLKKKKQRRTATRQPRDTQ